MKRQDKIIAIVATVALLVVIIPTLIGEYYATSTSIPTLALPQVKKQKVVPEIVTQTEQEILATAKQTMASLPTDAANRLARAKNAAHAWVIDLGKIHDSALAANVVAKLKTMKFATFTIPTANSNRQDFTIYAGPVINYKKALTMRTRINQQLSTAAVVEPFEVNVKTLSSK